MKANHLVIDGHPGALEGPHGAVQSQVGAVEGK
jgi:hypothetical protein